MTNLSQKIRKVSRDKLFYDKYLYCVDFKFRELNALRMKDHDDIDGYIERQHWKRQVNYGGSWRYHTFNLPITEDIVRNCHKLFDEKKKIKIDHKLVISIDTGHLYANTLLEITAFITSPGVDVKEIKQVVIDRPRDTLVIKSAKHNHRTYFKNQHLTLEQKYTLINFLKDRNDIRLGPGMEQWVTVWENHKYVADNYFIDHNDDGFLTMLALVSPIKIKKTITLLTE